MADTNYHILKLSHELTFIRVIPDVVFNHMSQWSYNFSKVLNFSSMKFRKLLGDNLRLFVAAKTYQEYPAYHNPLLDCFSQAPQTRTLGLRN